MTAKMIIVASNLPYHASKKVGSTMIVIVRVFSVHCPNALVERMLRMCVPASMSRKSMWFVAVGELHLLSSSSLVE